jgi:hypothetical protein
MHAHRHVGWPVFDAIVDQFRVGPRQLVRVLTDLAHLSIAQVGHVRIIELEVSATELRQSPDLFAVNPPQVGIEIVHVGIGLTVDRCGEEKAATYGRR